VVIKMVLLENILTTNGIYHRIEYRRDRCARAKKENLCVSCILLTYVTLMSEIM